MTRLTSINTVYSYLKWSKKKQMIANKEEQGGGGGPPRSPSKSASVKVLFVLKSWLFDHVEKRLDKKDKLIIYEATTWLTKQLQHTY